MQLYNLHEITGTIYIDNVEPKEINLIILKLKGKLNYYKKENEFYKISLNSDNLTEIQEKDYKLKLEEIGDSYRKTLDILNLYVGKYESVNKSNNQVNPIQSESKIIKETNKKTDNKIIKHQK